MSALSDLLQQANREGLSMQKITDRARARGHEIGKDTVWKYMSGRHGAPSYENLRALADVFPAVKLDALLAAAGVPPDLGEYTPPPEARALSRDEREAVDTIIKSMARSKVGLDITWHDGEVTAAGLTVTVAGMGAVGSDEELEEAAYHSPEPAGQPAPEHP